jgi:hypothetical protein
MKKLCEVTYTDKDTGHVRVCQNGTPDASKMNFGGMECCEMCLEDVIHKAMTDSGSSRKVVLAAARVARKPKWVEKLTNAAAKKSGKSRQQLDAEVRAATQKSMQGGET